MHGIAQLYGRYDQHGEGDEYVADLLHRTVDGQFSATESFESHVARLLVANQSTFSVSLQVMAVLHSKWLAALRWEMATVYLDAAVMTSNGMDTLPRQLYQFGDSLCDDASVLSRTAIELDTKLETGSKVRLSQLVSLPEWHIDQGSFQGIWSIYDVIVSNVEADYERFGASGLVPGRMEHLFQESQKRLRHVASVFARIRRDMSTTRIAENKVDFVSQATAIVNDAFLLGQQLWAPYLIGQPFSEAYNRKPTLDELNLGFDPWSLTDRLQAAGLRRDETNRQLLVEFWTSVDNPEVARRLVEQLDDWRATDAVRTRSGHGHHQVPWQAQLLVRQTISFDGRRFEPGDLITVYVLPKGDDRCEVQLRKTGKLTRITDLLGQPE